MENKQIMNAEEAQKLLATVCRGVMDKTVQRGDAKEVTNAIGKMIQIGYGQLQAAKDLGVYQEIPILGISEYALQNQTPKKLKLK